MDAVFDANKGTPNKFAARHNITHYRKQLLVETDETKRQMLFLLLAEQEAKLARQH
jgi:hypothetical protein